MRVGSLSPRAIALILFISSFLTLAYHLSYFGARDPDSVFFDPAQAFRAIYSTVRRNQARELTRGGFANPGLYAKAGAEVKSRPELCVGIPSIKRVGASYLEDAVGSVLTGLTEIERKEIYLAVFLVDPDPSVHDNYNSSWLKTLPNKVLIYRDALADVIEQLEEWERLDSDYRRKPLFDFLRLFQECYNTGAAYILMLEDDVVAADGWYYRTKQAIKSLERRRAYMNTIYIRLFYNEGLLGFNSESWFVYLAWSLFIDLLALGSLLGARSLLNPLRPAITSTVVAVICLVCVPMIIGLYFAAGGLVVQPLPPGLNRMDNYGCCSQALVFPRWRVQELVAYYERVGEGLVDMLTESYANQQGLTRWALTPAAFQHVGKTTSKGSQNLEHGLTATEQIFNFSFELMKSEELVKYHE